RDPARADVRQVFDGRPVVHASTLRQPALPPLVRDRNHPRDGGVHGRVLDPHPREARMIAYHAHPEVWLLVAVVACWYEWALRRVGPGRLHPIERVATRVQVLCFAGGLLTLWIAADWPVHDLAERYLFSVHMFQH